MENKTKEQLADLHCDSQDIMGESYDYNSFIAGWDARQPEIDALTKENNALKEDLEYIVEKWRKAINK